MHNHSYKFSFLVGWCCLLSISIVIMVAMIANGSNQWKEPPAEGVAPKDNAHIAKTYADPGQSSVNHIHLVWGNETSPWRHSSICFCSNTTLLLQKDLVIISTEGFYYTYAQVTFTGKESHEVTLVANENVPSKAVRKLSEAHGGGTVSMSTVILLRKGDRLKLKILQPSSIIRDTSQTYWGLYRLAEQKDK
ncbi:lymphotoxin-alpha isoform X2 [Tachysurus fulvidraco]|uniref:lymphotoxin-alpha isoform X2 n=1 Tax=Tachysurus fulvidraco TaxID=1234273 RepID=UPI001FF06C33|nr:lymphotoxin-alpha isoform X2 [Tachysurus fulvidraco]